MLISKEAAGLKSHSSLAPLRGAQKAFRRTQARAASSPNFEPLTPLRVTPAAQFLPPPLAAIFVPPKPQPAAPKQGAFKASGKTVVITGGSQGIGRATALLFARQGYNVVVAARDPQKLEYVAQDCAKISGRTGASLGVVCDVTDERQVRNLANTVLSKYEQVDVLVNNAGVMARGAFSDVPASEAERLMQTNYLGAYHVTQAFAPILMKEASLHSRPSIIMVNSFAGKVPMKNMSAFTASKYALMGFTEAIRAELGPHNVHVAQIFPGMVKSNHMERTTFYGRNEEEERKTFRQNLRSLPIAQTTQQVAEAIFQCSTTKGGDVVLGAPFAAVDAMYKVSGLNPFALPLAFTQ